MTEHPTRDLFEQELKHLLYVQEKACYVKVDHIEYVKAYERFMEMWGPEE